MRAAVRSKTGFAMLPMILAMFVVVGLISAGIMMLGPSIQRGKTVETKAGLEKAVDAIISWSLANNAPRHRLPMSAELPAVFGTAPVDAWGNPLVYIYDDKIANTAAANFGGICGVTATGITQGPANTPIAFLVISRGNDNQLDSLPNVSGPYTGNLNSLSQTDLFRVVTLEELKNRAGCYSSTQGGLKILNNELPSVCAGSATYPATLFPYGGVTGYTWSLISPPSWLTVNSSTGVLSPSATITNTAGTYPITVQLTDSHTPASNSVQKRLNLIVKACSAPGTTFKLGTFTSKVTGSGAATQNGAANTATLSGGGASGTTTGSACIWYPNSIDMTNGGYFRGYFNFKFNNTDNSANSATYGDGFVVTLMNGKFLDYVVAGTNTCSTTTNGIGYAALNAGGDRNSLAVEFDTYPLTNTTVYDPRTTGYYNHMTVISGGTVNHSATTNQLYPFRIPAANYKGIMDGYYNTSAATPPNWMEDGNTHNARIEITPDCKQGPTGYLVKNNSGEARYYRMTFASPFATTNYACSRTSIPNGSFFATALQPGWTLNTYTTSNCSGAAKSSRTYASVYGPPATDANADGCINLDNTDTTCTDPPATTKYRIFNNATAARYYKVNTGSGSGPCLGPVAAANATTLVPGGEFSPLNPLKTGWSIDSYTSAANCTSNTSPVTITYANAATADANGDSCVYIDNTDAKCALVKAWVDCTSCNDTTTVFNDTANQIASKCIAVSDSMNNTVFGITSGNGARSQSITISNFEATVKSVSPPVIPSFRVWNNTTSNRWVRINDGVTTSACSAAPVAVGEELTTILTPLVSGGTLYTYTNRTCTAGTTTTTYANINDPPSRDTNGDRCVQISGTGRSRVTDRVCPTIKCTLSTSPTIVAYNSTSNFTWTITNGPADGTWTPAPGGTCSALTSSSGGTCTSGPQTTAGAVVRALNAIKSSNPADYNTCSAIINVGCASYGVRNLTGATYRFKRPSGACVSVGNNANITNTTTVPLAPGQTISRYPTTDTTCAGAALGSITYDQAMAKDILVNGGNGNCLVYYSAGDTVTDR